MAKVGTEFRTAFSVYKVHEQVGTGGAGVVYRATAEDGAVYAIKCLAAERVTEEKRKRFKNELGFCLKDWHANIVRVVDHGVTSTDKGEAPFYVMPYYAATLRTELDGGVAPADAMRIYAKVLDGVEAAHLAGVCHRDLKPENILCSADGGEVVVADFGVARFAEEDLLTAVETAPAVRLANFRYSAPEQRVKGAEVTSRADIFALGLILAELFTGEVPQGADPKTIQSAHPEYGYLDEVVRWMTKQGAAQRPATLEEVKKKLIGMRAEAIARQRLEVKTREVVPAQEPDAEMMRDIVVGEVDYRQGALVWSLAPAPTHQWINHFGQAVRSHLMGYGPENIYWNGGSASLHCPVDITKRLNVEFREWTGRANEDFKAHLRADAKRKEADLRVKLEKERAEEEIRLKVLRGLHGG